jgi:fibronectin type 3 domain-containing protein
MKTHRCISIRQLFSLVCISILLIFMNLSFIINDANAAEVTLAWNKNQESTVTGYKLYYGTSSGSYQQGINVGNVTTRTVSSLSDGVTYYFSVTAYDSAGNESEYSSEVIHAIDPLCTVPSRPGSINYPSSSSTGTFSVSWDAVSGATSYELERSTSSSFSPTIQVYSGSSASFGQTGLESGTYYYRARAVNSCGAGTWRTGAAVMVTTCTVPSTPGSITYPSSSSTGTFSVSWDAVSGATSYVLERSTSSTFSPTTQIYSGSSASFSQSGLGSGTYYYRVRAVNSCAAGTWRTGAAVTVTTCTVPSRPGSISYPSSSSTGTFSVSWDAVSGATSYVLERSTSSTFSPTTQIYSGSSASFSQTGLGAGTYSYRVRAVNSCGQSDWSTGTQECRVSQGVKRFSFDIGSITFNSTNGSPPHPGLYHNFSDGDYAELFNGEMNEWDDAEGSQSLGLVGSAWRMVVPDQDTSDSCQAVMTGHGTFDIPPTNFEFTAMLSNFVMPYDGHAYMASVGTVASANRSLQCKAFATLISAPDNYAHGQSIALNGWVGTNDKTQDRNMVMVPLLLEGFDLQNERLGLRIEVSDEGQHCAAYYQRNDEEWELIGTLGVPSSDGTMYGWYAEGTSDVQLAVEAVQVKEEEPSDGATGGGGGGCLMNTSSSFGAEWVLLLLLLLVICRTRDTCR